MGDIFITIYFNIEDSVEFPEKIGYGDVVSFLPHVLPIIGHRGRVHEEKKVKPALWGWICWFGFLLILDFTIPFLALENVPRMTGSFLFWILWILAAIGSMFMIFLKWREPEDEEPVR